MAYDETNRGSMWMNDRKTEKFHSDMKGKINVNGVMHWCDGYLKDPNGHPKAPDINIKIGAPCEQQGQAPQAPQAPPAMPQMPQMIPTPDNPAPAQQAPQQQAPQAPQQAPAPLAAVPQGHPEPAGKQDDFDDIPFN